MSDGKKWCVTYTDKRDGGTVVTIGTQFAGEDYEDFAKRMLRPGFDWPWSDCTIFDMTSARRRGLVKAQETEPCVKCGGGGVCSNFSEEEYSCRACNGRGQRKVGDDE